MNGRFASTTLAIALMAAGSICLVAQAGFSRVVLQDQPLSVTGRHAVTARAEFGAGAAAGRHATPEKKSGTSSKALWSCRSRGDQRSR